MTVILFQGRFAPLVVAGTKTQTIRQPRKRPVKVGDRLSLRQWSGAAYRSPQVVLREAVCIETANVLIDASVLMVGDRQIANPYGFARADGFANWVELLAWFESTHGLPFKGGMIRWQV